VAIEQAIFTSALTEQSAGYQLVARSAGIAEPDVRALAAWGPSHDSLLDTGPDAVSINFHALPSGAYCVSRTTPGGQEYSGRAGQRMYTQCLVVPAEELARFSNNAFAVLAAAFAQGALRVWERIPETLEPIRLSGRATAVDQAVLRPLACEPGPLWLGALVQAAVSGGPLGLVGGAQRQRLLAGLINCLPVECRTELSFSTGLRYSPQRPFRVVGLSEDVAEQRRLSRQFQFVVLDPSLRPPRELAFSAGWGGFISHVVASGRFRFLAAELAQPRPGLTLAQLDELAAVLHERLRALPASDENDGSCDAEAPLRATGHAGTASRVVPFVQERADAPHRRRDGAWFQPSPAPSAGAISEAPADLLAALAPHEAAQWEAIEDLVFEAIAGKPGCVERLRTLWQSLKARCDQSLLEESRARLVRHALHLWRECVDAEAVRNPRLAVAALDVIDVLFG
jgi:hypothetical protein